MIALLYADSGGGGVVYLAAFRLDGVGRWAGSHHPGCPLGDGHRLTEERLRALRAPACP